MKFKHTDRAPISWIGMGLGAESAKWGKVLPPTTVIRLSQPYKDKMTLERFRKYTQSLSRELLLNIEFHLIREEKCLWYGDVTTELHFKGLSWHRDGQPAFIVTHCSGVVLAEKWYQYGKTHRFDGPAIRHYAPNGKIIESSWAVNGHHYSALSKIIKRKNKAELLINYMRESDQTYELAELCRINKWLDDNTINAILAAYTLTHANT